MQRVRTANVSLVAPYCAGFDVLKRPIKTATEHAGHQRSWSGSISDAMIAPADMTTSSTPIASPIFSLIVYGLVQAIEQSVPVAAIILGLAAPLAVRLNRKVWVVHYNRFGVAPTLPLFLKTHVIIDGYLLVSWNAQYNDDNPEFFHLPPPN
jgi:hypothetical protein